VLVGVDDHTGDRCAAFVPDPDRHGRVRAQVLHPIAAVPAAGEHVRHPVGEREPDLDLVGLAAHPTGCRQVAVVQRARVHAYFRRQRTAQITNASTTTMAATSMMMSPFLILPGCIALKPTTSPQI